MAKNRTLNEIRQSKEYQLAKQTGISQMSKNPFNHSDVDDTVKIIVENLKNEIYDIVFQAVCDEMNQFPAFDSSEYLTEKGLELFEDEWFEFYHEHHGNIIHQVIKDLK
jgi:ATP-dependent helicase/DNAse subunit B